MYLKSLEIQGFKSFPDHIVVEFHPGITAIVGPNGSGKSNVTEAVRWVLGEQSARNLRGSKMEDVIFNGSSARRRLSGAEVSIHFDNHDHSLPLAYDEVVITRRYFRSGESEYLLNKLPCRLKDITELLADTGIGKDGYSIIGQGKVDDILSERSEDRRRIFDEAAGIVKFKMRKADSERKLERTGQNLLRIDDIIGELEGRLEPLKKQAEEARVYDELSARVRDLDLALSTEGIHQTEKKLEALKATSEDFDAELAQIEKDKAALYAEREAQEQRHQAEEKREEELRLAFMEKSAALSALNEETALAGERDRARRQRLQDMAQLKSDEEDSYSELSEKIADRERHVAELREKRESISASLSAKEKELQEQEKQLDSRELKEEEQKKALDAIREKLFETNSQLFRLDGEAEQESAREQDDKLQAGQLEEAKIKVLAQVEEVAAEEKQKAEAVSLLLEAEKAARSSVDKAKAGLLEVETELRRFESEIRQKQFLLDTLKQLEENREGYHQAVKAISLEAEKKPDFAQGLLGPVAELIRVESRYETAVETSLGPALHNLVVETAEQASRFITWLKETRSGRETFLPLDKIEKRRLNPGEVGTISHSRGYMGTLDEFMEAPAELADLLAFLGGRIVLADNLQNALEISQLCQKRLRVVTLEGDLVNPGGSMTGGRNKKGLSGLLSRSREIDQTSRDLADLELKLKACQQQKEETTALLLNEGQKQENLQVKLRAAEQELSVLKERLSQLRLKVEEQTPVAEALHSRLEEYALHRKDRALKKDELLSLIAETQKRQSALQEELARNEDERGAYRRERDQLRENVADLRVSLGAIEESLNGVVRLKEQLESDVARREAERRARAEEKVRLEKELLDSREAEKERQSREKNLREAVAALENERKNLMNERLSRRDQESELFKRLEDLASREADRSSRREHSLLEAEQLDEKLREEKNRLWESYGLSYRQVEATAIELEDSARAARELKGLRNKIRALPAINHSAPEDYEREKTRYDFMQAQRADIEKSRKQLTLVIQELEEAMRSQFSQKFESINREFQKSFAALFEGGSAELLIGEGDLLDCPIEIKAQPPGKRLQNLTLLSGGERALTAIALLFAIFALRPAPFCILDEVESALDDSNVIRFTDYIRHYSEDTQFILVTHRKGTMEAAERLYGVTMKERGVSSLLSISLEDASLQEKN